MRKNAEQSGQKPAIVFEDRTVSWAELFEQVQSLAPIVHERLGSKKQAVGAILLPNSIDFIVGYLAIIHAGHVALPLDPAFKKLELDAILDQMKPGLLISNRESLKQISGYDKALTMDEQTYPARPQPEYLRLPAAKQVASLTFTSGTTGRPKAAPNTHANHLWNIEVCSKVWDWTAKDTLLVSVPLSHMLGIVMGLSGAIYHGNTLYLHRWFDETHTLEALASGKVSFFSHAASAFVKIAQAKGDYDLSSVRLCVSGAAPLPPAVWHDFKDRFGLEIVETYGTTETGRIAGNRLHERQLGSPGKVLPGVNLRLSDDGEVQIKSPGVFPGYYHNDEATKNGFTADGFWRTGDMAELRGGYVYLKGRVQERIRRFGYTVSPRDVEWAMHQHPLVSDIYVMGLQGTGQPSDELIYFIVSQLSDEEIKTYAKQNLLFAWRPDRIIKLNDLPRTRSGKISIHKLRQMAGETA